MKATSSSLKAVALGLNDKTLTALEMVLKGPGKGRWQLVDDDQAQVAIIDGDAVNALTLYDQQRRNRPGRPLVVISVREPTFRDILLVAKPVRVDTLLGALEQARQQLENPAAGPAAAEPAPPPPPRTQSPPIRSQPPAAETAPPEPLTPAKPDRTEKVRTRGATRAMEDESHQDLCGQNPDLDLTDPQAARGAFYDPRHHLQALVEQALGSARQSGKPVGIQALNRTLVLVPRQRQCLLGMSERQLRGLCLMAAIGSRDWFSLTEPTPEMMKGEGVHPRELDVLMWEVALWTARGRLPKGTDPFAAVSLRHWPNLTRLPRPPQALRIAALWTQGRYSPAETARLLNIPQRYVFAFYNGCRSLDLLDTHAPARTSDREAPATPKAAPRSLLRRILGALRGAA